jgi:hypothetical protein
VILLAINDYPLTLTLDARAQWRDDVPRLKGWEFSGNVGLRFSFWAPARHHSAQVLERPTFTPQPPKPTPPANPTLPDEAPAVAPAPAPTAPASSAPPLNPDVDDDEKLSDTEKLIRAAKKKLKGQ